MTIDDITPRPQLTAGNAATTRYAQCRSLCDGSAAQRAATWANGMSLLAVSARLDGERTVDGNPLGRLGEPS